MYWCLKLDKQIMANKKEEVNAMYIPLFIYNDLPIFLSVQVSNGNGWDLE